MKLGIFGFDKSPKCPDHKVPLVFIDEFIGNFLLSVTACLFDKSLAPPKDLLGEISKEFPNELPSVYHLWMFCAPLARGAKVVPDYIESLSKAYIKSLNRRQRNSLDEAFYQKKRDKLIWLGFKKIEREYIEFLKQLYCKHESFYDCKKLKPFSKHIIVLIQDWLINYIRNMNLELLQNKNGKPNLPLKTQKRLYDKILRVRNCLLLLGPKEFKEGSEIFIDLGENKLSYSFLLGFYDGDGGEGNTRLYSSNYSFLSQIKNTFSLNSKIRKNEINEDSRDLDNQSIERTKPLYDLALGARLLNKMMKSYQDSLKRKRNTFSEKCSASDSLKKKVGEKKNLKKLIQIHGKLRLAEMMKVSFQTLDKLCIEWGLGDIRLSPLERLKSKIKDKEQLIRMIENDGIDKVSKDLNVGYDVLKELLKEWELNARHLTVKEKLALKIGNKKNLQKLVNHQSLTKLAKRFNVGRNTLRRLCYDWDVNI